MQHLDQAGRAKSLAVGYGSKSCVKWLKPSILFTGTPGQYSISPLNLEELREESQKKKKWISDEIKQQSGKRGKQKAKMRINIKN